MNIIREYAWPETEVRARGGPQVGVDKAEFWETPSVVIHGNRVTCRRVGSFLV